MKTITKMERVDKKYFVVSFLELPYQNIEKYVCVLKSWVELRPEQRTVLVAYPNENPAITRNRIENIEKPEKHWTNYLATLEYISDEYDDADNWIATKYDDGVEDTSESTAPGYNLFSEASNQVVPKTCPEDQFDLDTLLNIKTEGNQSPPATGTSTWSLYSNSSSPNANEPEERCKEEPLTDQSNAVSQVTLKRSLTPNPAENNDGKRVKIEPANNELQLSITREELEAFIDTFLSEKEAPTDEERFHRNANVGSAAVCNETMDNASTSQDSTSSTTQYKPNPFHRPLISVLPDKYLLKRRAQSDESFCNQEPQTATLRECSQQSLAASASQTLINIMNRQEMLAQAAPTNNQTNLQLPHQAPVNDKRSSDTNRNGRRTYYGAIAPYPTAVQPSNNITNQNRVGQEEQAERQRVLPPTFVPQRSSRTQVNPAELTGIRNNQNAPPNSLSNNLPSPQSSRQLPVDGRPVNGRQHSERLRDMPQLSPSTDLAIKKLLNQSVNTEIRPQNTASTSNAAYTENQPCQQRDSYTQVTRTELAGMRDNQNGYTNSELNNRPTPVHDKPHCSRQLPVGGRQHSGPLRELPKLSPSTDLAKNLRNSINVNTDIRPQNTTSASNVPYLENRPQVHGRPNEQNSPAFNAVGQQGDMSNSVLLRESVIQNSNEMEYNAQRLPAQRVTNNTSSNMPNSSGVANSQENSLEPLVPLTVELLSRGECLQSQTEHPNKRRNKKHHTNLNSSSKRCSARSLSIEKYLDQREQQNNEHGVIKTPPLEQNCSKLAKLESERSTDNNLTLLVKGYLLEDPNTGIVFVQPCPGQNILEPRHRSQNTVKQERTEANTSVSHNHACQRERPSVQQQLEPAHGNCCRQNFHTQERCQGHHVHGGNRPNPQMVHQNTQHPMHMHGNNQRTDPQMVHQNTQHPSHMHGSNQRTDPQMVPQNTQLPSRMHGDNQRTDPQMFHQNTQQPSHMYGSNQITDPQMVPQNTQLPSRMHGGNQRTDPQMVHQNTQHPPHMHDSNHRPQTQMVTQNTQQPSRMHGSNRRTNPQMVHQNTQQPSHMHGSNRRTNPQMVPQNTQHPSHMHGGNQRTDPQMVPQNIQLSSRMHGGNQRPDPQMVTQNTQHPSHLHMDGGDYNHRPQAQMGPQNTHAQMNPQNIQPTTSNLRAGNHSSCSCKWSHGRQYLPGSNNPRQDPRVQQAVAERSRNDCRRQAVYTETCADNRPMPNPNSCNGGYPHARNPVEQQYTNPVNSANPQMCRCDSCQWTHR